MVCVSTYESQAAMQSRTDCIAAIVRQGLQVTMLCSVLQHAAVGQVEPQ